MTRSANALLLLAATLSVSCAAVAPGSCPPRAAGRVRSEASLSFGEVASLPGGVILLAGSFREDAGPIRSALFVSRDGGLTWCDAGLAYDGCEIRDLRTFGTSNVWAIATFVGEGTTAPERVLRSDDAGATWASAPVEPGDGLTWTHRFEFDDARHGLLSVADSLGRVRTFRTDDGGASWRRMWTARRTLEIEEGAYAPPGPAMPPTAPLWEREADAWRVAGWLRLREGPGAAIIEARGLGGRERWRERARLPLQYRTAGALRALTASGCP